MKPNEVLTTEDVERRAFETKKSEYLRRWKAGLANVLSLGLNPGETLVFSLGQVEFKEGDESVSVSAAAEFVRWLSDNGWENVSYNFLPIGVKQRRTLLQWLRLQDPSIPYDSYNHKRRWLDISITRPLSSS